MPDTKILAGVNVTTAKVSPLGQFAIAQMQSGVAQLQAAFAALGFNPLTDATELLMASAGDPAKSGGLVMMDGVFKVDQIATALNGQTQIYAGATLVVLPAKANEKGTPAVAFIGSTMAVAGDVTAVKAALDRAGAPTTVDPALVARANALSADDDVWIASSAPVASLLGTSAGAGGAAAPMLQVLSSIQSFSGALKFGGNVQAAVQAVASSDKNAQALGDVARLVVSMGSMGATKDAEGAALIQALQSLQISTSGSNVNLALNLPEAQVEGLIKSLMTTSKPNGN